MSGSSGGAEPKLILADQMRNFTRPNVMSHTPAQRSVLHAASVLTSPIMDSEPC